jgi:hypothetical protein
MRSISNVLILVMAECALSADPMTSSMSDQLLPVDIFSSVTELSRLLARERDFLKGLQELADKLETSAAIIKSYLKVQTHCFNHCAQRYNMDQT